jgi:hypothetical protein
MKNLKDYDQDTNTRSKKDHCKKLKSKLGRKIDHLYNLESRLDDLLDGFETDSSEMYNLSELIKMTKHEILRLQKELQRHGCFEDTRSEVTYDNQTVISTSSVRRKDARSLSRTPVPSYQNENQY